MDKQIKSRSKARAALKQPTTPFKGRPHVWRDPVHGDIFVERSKLGDTILEIIDTREFQRLRGIRQNGVMNLVFHGAEHSRYAHSVGAYHVSCRMFDAIVRNSNTSESHEARGDAALATLLHDVGHGPFSHTLEEVIRAVGRDFDHENMTVRFLTEPDSAINKALRKHDPDLPSRLVPVFRKKDRTTEHWWYSLVSSQLDADRIDYLSRDGSMAGVQHRFDYQRLVSALGLLNNRVVVDARAADVLQSYLLALEEMYAVAYYHKTVRAASVLLTQTLRRAADLAESKKNRARLFPKFKGAQALLQCLLVGEKIPLNDYAILNEHVIWALIGEWEKDKDSILAKLSSMLLRREFPKTIELDKGVFAKRDQALTDAKSEFERTFPKLDPSYFVVLDEPSRTSYKRIANSEGPNASIGVVFPDGELCAVEELKGSLAQVVSERAYYPRLIVPLEIRNTVKNLLETP